MFPFSNNNETFQFDIKELTQRSQIIIEILLTTSLIEFIDKKECAKAVLDKHFETFIVYMITLEAENSIYSLQIIQIAL